MIATFGDHRNQINTNILKDGVIGEIKLIFRVPTN